MVLSESCESSLAGKLASAFCERAGEVVRDISALRAKFYASPVFGRIPAMRGRAFRSNCYAISASIPCADYTGADPHPLVKGRV
jgi:hypothetical protein